MGIESDGTIKGCPSLATSVYARGNVRDMSVERLWKLITRGVGMTPERATLWGFCADCYYADVCGGGCTWTAHSLLGAAGNNPFCHHRALTLAARGRRERIVKVEDAPNESFAVGRFALVEEGLDGSDPTFITEAPALPMTTVPRRDPPVPDSVEDAPPRTPPARLRQCRACNAFVYSGETVCPFCHSDLRAAEAEYRVQRRRRRKLMQRVEEDLRARGHRDKPR
jgi:radical SAM protein with 4Fe4S-binding SPASM domain